MPGMNALDELLSVKWVGRYLKDVSGALTVAYASNIAEDVQQARRVLLESSVDSGGDCGSCLRVLENIASCFEKGTQAKLIAGAVPVIGQCQLLRRHISTELNLSAKHDSGTYLRALDCLRRSLVMGETGKENKESHQDMLKKLTKHLEYTGLNDPFAKVYLAVNSDESSGTFMLLSTLNALSHYSFNSSSPISVTANSRRSKHTPDFTALAVGMATVLRQFTVACRLDYLNLLRTFYRMKLIIGTAAAQERGGSQNPSSKLSQEVMVLRTFLSLVVLLLGIDRSSLPVVLSDSALDVDVLRIIK